MIQSVSRALGILEAIGDSTDGDMGLVEISRRMGLEKSTVHNLVSTLKLLGYVEQNGDGGRYRLGSKLFELSHGSIHADARHGEILGPLACELKQSIGENVSVVAYRRGELSIICREQCDNEVVTVPNRFKPLYTTVSGRCLLAQLSPEQLKNVIDVLGLPQDLWEGACDEPTLLKKLDHIRRSGSEVLISPGREIGGVGYIIPSGERMCPLAVGTALPLYRFRKKRHQLIRQVGEYAEKMSLLVRQMSPAPIHHARK